MARSILFLAAITALPAATIALASPVDNLAANPLPGCDSTQPRSSQSIAPIPVATRDGIRCFNDTQYAQYVHSMGHLPVMSNAYVFGRTIPPPKTDSLGHIRVSNPKPLGLNVPADLVPLKDSIGPRNKQPKERKQNVTGSKAPNGAKTSTRMDKPPSPAIRAD